MFKTWLAIMATLEHFDILAPLYDRLITLENIRQLERHLALPSPGKHVRCWRWNWQGGEGIAKQSALYCCG